MASLTMATNTAYLMIVNKANGLRSADTFGGSDPYVRIQCPAAPACLDETTQAIPKNLNPIWGQCYLVCLPPNIPPVIKFSVYDSDKGTFVDGNDDFLGHAGLDLSQAIASNVDIWHSNDLVLGGDKAKGTLNILVKAYADPTITIERATKLRNADGFFGKSDPYVRLSGLTGRQMIWGETKTVRDNLNPEFNNEKFVISLLSKLPMGGALSSFKIELWDEDDKKRSSSDDPLGMATLPWINLFPDPNVPKLSPLKLVDRGAKSGSTVTVSVTMPKKSLELQQNLAGVGRSLLQNAISLTPSANQGGGGGGIPITKPPIKIAKSSCKANLAKGLGFKIADCTDNIADRYTIGLAWDVTNGVDIDLDASCVWLDSNLQPIDTVWFQKLRSADGSMQHCGDEREGDAVGDDESIMFDLERVSPRATYLCFCINSFTGQLLSNVASAKCRMYNTLTLNEIASFDLTNNDQMNSTALLMCILYRNQGINSNGQEWFFYAVGESADGRTVQDNIDEFQVFLTKHPLSKLSQSNQMISKPPQIAKIKVPPNTGSNNTIGFKLPSGASEQVKLPPSAQAGDVVEVPLIDVFAVE